MPLAGDVVKEVIDFLEKVEGYDNTLITIPVNDQDLHDGQAFMGGYRWEGVSDGTSIELIFHNPDDSGKECHVSTFSFVSDGLCFYEIYLDSTISSSGTDIPLINRLIKEGEVSVATLERDGTYSQGDAGPKGQFGAGGNRFKAAGETITDLVHIREGHNFHIVITNESGSSSNISVNTRWIEKVI